MLDHPVKTPCIGVCSTGIGDSVCRGCKRFSHEVIDWNSYSNRQQQIVDERLSGFLSQCVSNKFIVTDAALLKWQLQVQNVRYIQHHDEYCWLFSLLKAGAGQIESPKGYGFEVDQLYRGTPLVELREQVDNEYLILSQAHYDRYIATPDLFASRTE